MKKTLTALTIAAISASPLLGQLAITQLNTAQVDTFNGIGSTATATIPSHFRMSPAGTSSPTWSAVGNLTATTQASSSGSPTAGGRYNWGNGTTPTDRAIGFMTSGSFSSPNSIMAAYSNNTGSTWTEIDMSFRYERYRINSAAAAVTFFTSLNGSTWSAVTAGDSGAFSTGTSAYNFTNGTVVSRSFTISDLSISQGSTIYLRWNFNTTGSNSQGLGLDDVSFTPVPEASTVAVAALALLGTVIVLRRRRMLASK